MERTDPFEPLDSHREVIRFVYGKADKELDRDFDNMTFEQLVGKYMNAIQGINNLLHVEDGESMLEIRCDDRAVRTLEIVKNLRQYKTEIVDYFNSLKERSE